MAEARIGCIAIIKWIWTQVKRRFSYMVENSQDNQVLVDMDASASRPRLPVVVPPNQETMVCVPSGPSSSNDSHPSSSSCLPSSSNQVLVGVDASASLPSSSSPVEWKYDVFLSFRGADTRRGITVDIYDGLDRRGIKAFMDDPDLVVGDSISPTLIAAIKGSKFAIVILSQNYASSTWCLEELREICLSMEDSRILPLFYQVDPTDVRYQKKSFGEAFSNHESSGRYESEKVNHWKAALNKVANISGWNTQDYKTHKELVNVIVDVLIGRAVPEAIESTADFQAFEATRLAMDEVMKALKDDEVAAVGVYGMGGVGKTTLVEHVGAQTRKSGIFDYVTKCVVSQHPDFEKLQYALAEQLGFELPEKTEIGRAARLSKEIRRRQRILIILDDIWERTELSRIGIPSYKELQKCNSKVLLTTRIRNVCHAMECQRKITLNILSEQDSWALFVSKARTSFESSSTFEGVAKKVAGECRGLPIALVTVARALGDKELVEWETAALLLKKSQTANPDDYGEATKCIKLSYDYLKNEDYKSYFLLCCFFPEDFDILTKDLFRYAIRTRLFRDAETLMEAREHADSVVKHLKYSCLLLDSEEDGCVRMHDVVRDAAIQIVQSEDEFFVKAGCGLEDWPRNLHKGYLAISLMGNYIRELPKNLVCPKLQILLLNRNFSLENIPETFFQCPNELRVLDLSLTGLSLLPKSFGFLTNLTALYFDDCDLIRIDTSILGKLKKLEMLSMRNSRLYELSVEIGGLTNLRMLDITGNHISRIPSKLISKLHDLEELYMQGFWKWKRLELDAEGEEEVNDTFTNASFDEVTSLSKLRVLKVTIRGDECIPKYVEKMNLVEFDICIGGFYMPYKTKLYGRHRHLSILLYAMFSHLPKWFRDEIMKKAETLCYSWCQRLIDIFMESEHGRLQRLKHLHIVGYRSRQITEVDPAITWVPRKPVFENLEELYLDELDCAELRAVQFLPPGSLFKLKVLKVEKCYNWWNILLPSTLLERLPNLEELSVCRTDGSEYMFGYEALLVLRQLKLKKINLYDLATVSICEGPAPPAMLQNLQSLSIIYCKLEGSLFTSDVAQCLSQLNSLKLEYCPLLERIVEASNKKTVLPKLKRLYLVKLPMLFYESATFDIVCPELEEFFVSGCSKFSASSSDFDSRKQVEFSWRMED